MLEGILLCNTALCIVSQVILVWPVSPHQIVIPYNDCEHSHELNIHVIGFMQSSHVPTLSWVANKFPPLLWNFWGTYVLRTAFLIFMWNMMKLCGEKKKKIEMETIVSRLFYLSNACLQELYREDSLTARIGRKASQGTHEGYQNTRMFLIPTGTHLNTWAERSNWNEMHCFKGLSIETELQSLTFVYAVIYQDTQKRHSYSYNLCSV